MNAADIVADRLIQRGIYLERYKSGFNNRILAELEKLEDSLTRELASGFARGIPNTSARVKRLEKLLGETRQIIKRAYSEKSSLAGKELLQLAKNEQTYVVDAVTDAAGGIMFADRTLNYDELKALTDDTLIEGARSAEWWSRQGEDLTRRFSDTVRMGVMRGETLDQLVARVRGTQARAFTDGVMTASKRQAAALVRTSVQTVANTTRLGFYAANADVVSAIQWVATLDSRTTHICMALNGKMWSTRGHAPIGHDKAYPGPTAHWACRSTQVPVLKKWEDLVAGQDEDAVNAEYARQLKKQGFSDDEVKSIMGNAKYSLDGKAAKDVTFDDWLSGKSHDVQDQMLGKGKAKLFRDSKITMTDLIDQSGRPLTLEQLVALPQPRPANSMARVNLPIKRPKRHITDTDTPKPGRSEPPLVSTAAKHDRKSPVSKSLRMPDNAQRGASYSATLRVVDSVHDDGVLPAIPLVENRATVNIGEYAYRGITGQSIDLTVSRAGPHPELTLVHEIGHFIDHQALDVRGDFASEKSDLLAIWRKIVMASPTYKKIKLASAGRKIDGLWPKRHPDEFAEMLRLREVWARAYTQYIAIHGGNLSLRAQFDVAAERMQGLYFWPDDEFESIDLAITTLFTAKQWLT